MNSEYFEDKIFTVSELGEIIRSTVGEIFYGLSVEGEVCNFKVNQTRHWYFSIKDKEGSTLNCTCFAGNNWKLKKPENGDYVVLKGSLSFWVKGGTLSFNAEDIKKKGEGDLRAEIEKRRAYYKSLGYFDEERKRSLPKNIKTIGIVTSAEGAVIHDIMNVTRRRAPGIDLLLFPSLVQGKGAEISISKRIRQANNFASCDVLIVGRGGGSEEDLAPYSSAEVIEAIYNSEIPVISAVGHDSDFPLSDFVADLRAPTPSAAAELVTEEYYQRTIELGKLKKEIDLLIKSIFTNNKLKMAQIKTDTSSLFKRIERYKGVLNESKNLERVLKGRLIKINYEKASLDSKLESDIEKRIKESKIRLNSSIESLKSEIKVIKQKSNEKISNIERSNSDAISRKMLIYQKRIEMLKTRLDDLNPLSILERGYAIVRTKKGKIIKKIEDVELNESITIRVNDGTIRAKAEDKHEL